MTGNLFGDTPEPSLGHQHHEAVKPKIDRPRLKTQFGRIMEFMRDGLWHTQYDIAAALEVPQGSVGSQIRNARVDGFKIEKRRQSPKGGTWEYRMEDTPDGAAGV